MATVVVTGASAGIGAACVSAFQALGAEVVGLDIADTSGADRHLTIDIASPDCGETLLGFLGEGPVDGLVNNAAIGLDKNAVGTTAADFDSVLAVNLRAPLLLASALHPNLKAQRGFVVNVASVHALATTESVAAYAASKGGLVALTRALAVEWAPDVRVNAVLPGAVRTSMLEDGLRRVKMTMEELGARSPMRRVGEAREIADAVVALASLEFSTGTALVVDGGAIARLSTE